MSTRANVYICDTFIAEIGNSAYPVNKSDDYYEDSFWALMKALDESTEQAFEDAVRGFVNNPDYLPPKSYGVANWSYEYCWIPVQQPVNYHDWANWKGIILVRQPDPDFATLGYYTVPGPWRMVRNFRGRRK